MRSASLVLLTGFVLLIFAVPVARTATPTEAESETEPITAVVTQAGPHRWVNPAGPSSGDVTALALCRDKPEVLYVACSYGVYKSTDGAVTWQPTALLRSDGRAHAAEDVAVDPTNPLVVYAVDGDGVFKSTDGGGSWSELDPGRERWSDARAIVVDAANPDTVYVEGGAAGVFKTTDGGATWEIKNNGLHHHAGFGHFGMDPRFPSILYGVPVLRWWHFMSEDDGATWSPAGYAGREGDDKSRVSVQSFTRDPDDDKRLTIGLVCDGTPARFESADAGKTWQPRGSVPPGLWIDALQTAQSKSGSMMLWIHEDRLLYITTDGADTWRAVGLPFQARRLRALRVGGEEGDVLYAGDFDDLYYYSVDGGQSWELFYSAESDPDAEDTATIAELRKHFLYGLGSTDLKRQERAFFEHATAVHPSKPNVVYCATPATYQGVLRTDDFGKTWLRAEGLSTFRTHAIACACKEPGLIYALVPRSIHKSTNGGTTWQETGADALGYMTPFGVHPLDSRILLVGQSNWGAAGSPVVLSTDGGETWTDVPSIERNAEGFLFDSKDADTFYVLTHENVFKTSDRGQTWHVTSGTMQPKDDSGSRRSGFFGGEEVDVRQANAETIYTVRGTKTLLRSTDLGKTWKGLERLKIETRLRFVQVHPVDPKVVIAAECNGRLHMSRDAGETWRTVQLPEDPLHEHWWSGCIGMDQTDLDVFYVGGYDNREGVLRTRDGGKTFEELNNALPHADIYQIVVSPADGAVYAVISGAGVYHLEIDARTAGEGNQD